MEIGMNCWIDCWWMDGSLVGRWLFNGKIIILENKKIDGMLGPLTIRSPLTLVC